MREYLFHMKRESMASAITCIVIGILFIAWPGSMLTMLLRLLALVLLVEGVICLYRMLKGGDSRLRGSYAPPTAACFIVGLMLLAAPRFVAGIFPVIIGLFLLFHGIKGVATARYGSVSTMGGTLGALIMIALGIFLIARPFSALRVLMVIVGIALVYDGAVSLHLVGGIRDKAQQFREKMDPNVIDVDYIEEED